MVSVPGSKTVLLELVGEQPMPNLIPALEYRPDTLVFLVSERTRPHALHTQAALESVPELASTRFRTIQVDPYSIDHAAKAVEELLGAHAGAKLTLNITGGTKTMALGAYRAARGDPWRDRVRVLYVSTELETEQVIAGETVEQRHLDLQIAADLYLRAHGANVGVRPPPYPASWTGVAFDMARQIERDAQDEVGSRTLSQMLARVARASAGMSDSHLRTMPVEIPRKSVRSAGLYLLRQCQDAGILGGLALIGGEVRFTLSSSRALEFLKGGWLEAYVAGAARRSEVFHDVQTCLPIAHPLLGNHELDVVAMRGVVAVLCSCKAARVPNGPARNVPLDELEARSRALGRYCGKVFVTSRVGYTDTSVTTARGMGIHLVRPQALTTVGEVLVAASHSKGQRLDTEQVDS